MAGSEGGVIPEADLLDLFTCTETQRLRGLLMSVLQVWEPGQMYEGGAAVLIDNVIYRAVRPAWNVYPGSRAGQEFWIEIGRLTEKV